jgi:hypothetical protein
VLLLLFLFGLVRTFNIFVRHRPIHTNRRRVEQPINVEEVCSVRVIFSIRGIRGTDKRGAGVLWTSGNADLTRVDMSPGSASSTRNRSTSLRSPPFPRTYARRYVERPVRAAKSASRCVAFELPQGPWCDGSDSCGARSSDTDAIGLDSEESGLVGAGPAIVTSYTKPRLWIGWGSPFWLQTVWGWRLLLGITIRVFVILLLFVLGLVRIFSIFVWHRPIHTNRRRVEQSINVEEVCSIRVIFSFGDSDYLKHGLAT